jgi:hypothetical protein
MQRILPATYPPKAACGPGATGIWRGRQPEGGGSVTPSQVLLTVLKVRL